MGTVCVHRPTVSTDPDGSIARLGVSGSTGGHPCSGVETQSQVERQPTAAVPRSKGSAWTLFGGTPKLVDRGTSLQHRSGARHSPGRRLEAADQRVAGIQVTFGMEGITPEPVRELIRRLCSSLVPGCAMGGPQRLEEVDRT
jgi:hypothetical protein